ncbi:MAG: hypothetical protein FJ297_00475 [Planctomycetes bacterium]|nr:hypothetical protein [Planctomycetota bacterium]
MPASRPSAASFAVAFLLCVPPTTSVRGQQGERENVNLTGTVADLGPGLMQMTEKSGTSWLIKVEPERTEVQYLGTALADWVRPGTWVQIRANLNQKLQADAIVTEMTVFTPKKDMQLGVVQEFSFSQGGFGGFAAGESDPKADKDKADKDKADKDKADKDKAVACLVRGRFLGIKKNKMTIQAGQPITVEVGDDLKVLVEVSDYTLARPGDKVDVRGWKYESISGRAIATELVITSETPLESPKPKGRGTSRRSSAKDADKEPPSEKPADEDKDKAKDKAKDK